MRRLLLTGLNHSTAPLALRERLALPADRAVAATAEFRRRFADSEVVFLSTCNRVEVYTAASQPHIASDARATDPNTPHDGGPDIASFLADFHGVPRGDFFASLYTKRARDAAVHLFNVAASLDSMVLGETQILGQVRAAYDASRQLGSTGPMLNGLFQRAIAAGKRVMSQTPLVEGRCSAASVAVDFARGIFEHFQDKNVLCVGSGKMVALVLQHFAALRPGRLTVLGRDVEKAKALAIRHNGDGASIGASIDLLSDRLAAADIIITSTGASHPIVTRELFRRLQRRRRFRPAFIIDLAVPRDVEAAVGTLDNVHLYNIDDLQQVVGNTERLRGGAIEAARAILAQHVQEWAVWNRQRELGPAIRGLYDRYQQLARQELRRALASGVPSGAGAISDERIEALARRLANKLLHEPMRVLRSPALGHEGARYLHAMNELFGLGLTGGAGGDASLDEAALNELAEIAREAAQTDASSEPEPEPHFESDSKAEPPA